MSAFYIVLIEVIAIMGACSLADKALEAYRMKTRARNIAAAGWPPAHVDVDGDPVFWDSDGEAE